MKLLFDQGTPAPLRRGLTAHIVKTAREMNWDELGNGDLLRAAEYTFDALVTTDQNLKYQQNRSGRKLAILVLPTTSWPRIERHLAVVVQAIDNLSSGDFVELQLPE
ncbi:MAG: hypothetical protein JNM86_15510 [Phycisphaerae bacterium]|nr:hypothetical protein [Phycisphaerae bacterium]